MNKTNERIDQFEEVYHLMQEKLHSLAGQQYTNSDIINATLKLMEMKQKDEIIEELATWEFS